LTKHDSIGGYDFTLSKVVSARNQEIEGILSGSPNSDGKAKVKISGTELKEDFDKTICTFNLKLEGMKSSGYIFLTFN